MKVQANIINNDILTPKEGEVLRYLCEGLMRAEIAVRIFRTQSTVSKHIESIAFKFGAHSSAEIVAFAVAKGLVKISLVHKHKTALIKCILLALMINQQHMDLRQPPRLSRSGQLLRSRIENSGHTLNS